MGRGRAKAKQTKVARRLKYHSPNTDLDALERELGGGTADGDDEPDAEYDSDVGADEPREEDWLPKKRLRARRDVSAARHSTLRSRAGRCAFLSHRRSTGSRASADARLTARGVEGRTMLQP